MKTAQEELVDYIRGDYCPESGYEFATALCELVDRVRSEQHSNCLGPFLEDKGITSDQERAVIYVNMLLSMRAT